LCREAAKRIGLSAVPRTGRARRSGLIDAVVLTAVVGDHNYDQRFNLGGGDERFRNLIDAPGDKNVSSIQHVEHRITSGRLRVVARWQPDHYVAIPGQKL